jgi:hypothetical protein
MLSQTFPVVSARETDEKGRLEAPGEAEFMLRFQLLK